MRNGLRILTRAAGWAGRIVGAAALAAVIGLASAADAQARCQSPNFCKTPGACLSIGQVKKQVARAYGREGWRVARVRLVGGAPTPSCLWYEVMLSHPKGRGGKLVYWGIRGGRVG